MPKSHENIEEGGGGGGERREKKIEVRAKSAPNLKCKRLIRAG